MRNIFAPLLIASAVFAGPRIEIKDPWVRLVPPVSTMSAAYMEIVNSGDQSDKLVGVETDISKKAEIHTTLMENGTAKMRHVKEIEIPAGGSVKLRPGGYHIMLIDLKDPLKESQKVTIKLKFLKSGEVKVEAPVKSPY